MADDVPKKIKPECKLICKDGNVFNLVGIAAKALRSVGQDAEATEMTNRVFAAGSYDEALSIITNYVDAY